MLNNPEKRAKADEILTSNKSDDLKLFEVFEIYKDDLRDECGALYYALLGWKDSHLKALLGEKTESNIRKLK